MSAIQTVPIKNCNGQPDQSPQSGSTSQRLVVVRFTRCVFRDNVFSSRMKLKNYNQGRQGKTFINEDLDAGTEKTFSEFRALVKS